MQFYVCDLYEYWKVYLKGLENTFISTYIQHLTHSSESVGFFIWEKTLSYGVIGNTSDFGSEIQGSSPCGTTREMSRGIIGNTSDSGSEVPSSSLGGTTKELNMPRWWNW